MGRAEQGEDAEIHIILRQKSSCRIKSREIEAFVELLDCNGMNRLEADSDFKPSVELPRERERSGANGIRVRLDGDGSEGSCEPGYSQHVF